MGKTEQVERQFTTTVMVGGRLTIPAAIRNVSDIHVGDMVDASVKKVIK